MKNRGVLLDFEIKMGGVNMKKIVSLYEFCAIIIVQWGAESRSKYNRYQFAMISHPDFGTIL